MTIELEWLRSRYLEELNSLYAGEIEHLNRLPQLVEGAQGPALKSAFQYHLEKTRTQVGRLHQIFANLRYGPVDDPAGPGPAPVRAASATPLATDPCDEGDLLLVAAARKIEQHEIARYLMALNCAEILWDHTAADLLEMTLAEEYEIDQVLAGLSQPAPLPIKPAAASLPKACPERVG